jgi:hypothetical protein
MNSPNAKGSQSMLWGFDLATWEAWGVRLMFVGAGLGVLGLGAALASSFVLWWASGTAQEALRESQDKLALAMKTAEIEIARAKEETAKARLEQEKLKAVVQWRLLSQVQGEALVNSLVKAHGTVTIAYVQNEPEAMWFGMVIERMFGAANQHIQGAKWKLSLQPRMYSDRIIFGVAIFGKEGNALKAVKDGFKAAQVPFNEDAVPTPVLQIGAMTTTMAEPNTDVVIMVGSRRPVH